MAFCWQADDGPTTFNAGFFMGGGGGSRSGSNACQAFYRFFATSLINSIIYKYKCKNLFIICHLNYFVIANLMPNIYDVVIGLISYGYHNL